MTRHKIKPNIANHLHHRINHTLIHHQPCILQENVDVMTMMESEMLENKNRIQLLLHMTQFHNGHIKHGHLNSLISNQKGGRFVHLPSR